MGNTKLSNFENIAGLMLPSGVPDSAADVLVKELTKFAEYVPDAVMRLEKFYGVQDLMFLDLMNEIQTKLTAIMATKLAQDAANLAANYIRKRTGQEKQLLLDFTSRLTSLVLDIQVAISRTSEADANAGSIEMMKYSNLLENCSMVKDFLDQSNVVKAKEAFLNIDSSLFEDANAARSLLLSLHSAKVSVAKVQLDILIEQVNAKMKTFAVDTSAVKRKVLTCDDRPEILVAVSEVLKPYYQVLPVPSAAMALKALEKHTIDMFVLDIEMPEVTGFDLAEIIRATPAYKNTPIAFLTGNASKDYVMKAMSFGRTDFIVKPIVANTLLMKIRQYFV